MGTVGSSFLSYDGGAASCTCGMATPTTRRRPQSERIETMIHSLQRLQPLLGGLLLSAVLAFVASGQPRVHAAVGCRGDPVVQLSNGAVLDLNLSINDALSDVQHIAYTLHGPIG